MSTVVERLINLLAYLVDSPRPVTAERIRNTVAGYENLSDQAFHRKFERDKASLRELGIELEQEATDAWEVEWGYVVPESNYRTIEPGLTDEERTALALAVHMVRSGGWPSGANCLLKLGGARLTDTDTPVGADLGLGSQHLGLIFQAVLERRRILCGYRGRPRTLCTYAMHHRRGRWYFAGVEPEQADTIRTYRLDRAEQLELVGEPDAFPRPEGYGARDILSSLPWEQREPQRSLIECDPEIAWWVENRFPDARAVGITEAGGTILEVPFVNDSLLDTVIHLDDGAVILEPPELRAAMVRRLEAGR
ncbi:MAG: WYL domain-containing protein [Acidimicrobiia bacterium]|nr:WYL domain-containing protein [Acidimicrobiia bacterium]